MLNVLPFKCGFLSMSSGWEGTWYPLRAAAMIHDHPPKAPRRALSKRLLGTYLTLQLCREFVV